MLAELCHEILVAAAMLAAVTLGAAAADDQAKKTKN